MQVKIDTKEKFHVITIQESSLTANMTEELGSRLLTYLQSPVKNMVLNIKDIKNMDDAAAEALIHLQQRFYEKSASFVVCELDNNLEVSLDKSGLLEILNVVPTESEAYDIVQMEEIERELLGEG